jgi:dTDP-4-amino-4,6-dideoxygalactose transaminase
VIRVKPEFGMSRDDLMARLAERGVHCSVHFIPNHTQPYFQRFLDEDVAFPNADAAFDEILSLPFYHSLTTREVETVCALIADYAGSRRRRPAVAPGQLVMA